MKHILLASGAQVAVYFQGKTVQPNIVPYVLLHGFCEDASLWDPLLPYLQDISMLTLDLPGFGQSDLPAQSDMAAYADAVAAVLDQLEIPRCILVGHSLGGYVALEFGAQRGERLAGLGLFHSHPFTDSEERKTARDRGIETLRAGKRDLYVTQLFPNLFAPAFATAHPEVVAALISTGKKQSAEGIIAALEAMKSRRDHQQTLKKLGCPALFLLGSDDALIPLEQGWQAALLPGSVSVEILDGVGHMGMYEDAEKSAAVLKSFYETAVLLTP